jgi:choline-glycine betaine transporter
VPEARDQKPKQNKGCPDAAMADKVKPGRGIELPFVEFGEGKPWHVKFNPFVTGLSIVAIWTFIIYTLVSPAQASKEWSMWFAWVGDEWTWFYMASQNIWLFVIFYLMLTKYGNLKFGGDDTEPEFSKLQWFGMMYTCGVAVGLFYLGVHEPHTYYMSSSGVTIDASTGRRLETLSGAGTVDDWSGRWSNMNDADRANYALMQTYFHWGIHGWIPYVLIGALMGLLSYRRGLPMTMRSCFYPLWGKQIEGWRGDVVDVLSIMCTLFGVCTSLGLGVRQLNRGLIRMDRGTYMGVDYFGSEYTSSDPMRKTSCGNSSPCRDGKMGWDFNVKTQCWIVALITMLATCSVALGLKRGIAVLSYLAFAMGMLLVTSVLFMDDTMYILDAMTTSFGYYLWYLPKIAWECDAWARLNSDHSWHGSPGSGGMAKDSTEYGPVDGLGAGSEFHSGWTVFFWGWWISWGPFCGTFLAKISKGRTLREFIIYAMIVPTLYCVLWFGTFGGAAIGMQMRADHIDAGTTFWGKDATHPLDTRMAGFSNAEHNRGYVVDLSSSGSREDKLFDVLSSYGGKGLGYGLTGFAWLCLLFYFITSSDSGSLVIDMISANGEQEPPLVQRIFWAVTEGCAAIALLKGSQGDPDRALNGVSAVSVVCGLPFTVVLMYMSHALYLCCLEEAGDLDENRPSWRTVCLGLPKADEVGEWVKSMIIGAVAPFVPIWKVLTQVEGSTSGAEAILSKEKMVLLYTGISAVCIYFASILLIFSTWEANLRMIAASLYLAFACVVAYTRYMTRTGLGIQFGDALTDVCLSVLFYPLVLAQCERECALGTIGGAPPQEKAKVSEA